MWPASALLTGNGVAFVLRVPGTEHGDWWSMHGWWIFAGTAAVALLSKYLIRFRGRHVFNPSNFGLVLCFLLLGPERADPLALLVGADVAPGWCSRSRSSSRAGSRSCSRLAPARDRRRLLGRVRRRHRRCSRLSGHEMTARWHLGPITGFEFWRVLVFSPEILVFLFFMITDPKTIPEGRTARRVYAVGVGLLAVLLIAPQTTEFADEGLRCSGRSRSCARRGRCSCSCRARSLGPRLRPASCPGAVRSRARSRCSGRRRSPGCSCSPASPPGPERRRPALRVSASARLPEVTVVPSQERLDEDRPGERAPDRARRRPRPPHRGRGAAAARPRPRQGRGARGARLQGLWQQIDARREGRDDRRPRARDRADAGHARGRSRPGAAARRSHSSPGRRRSSPTSARQATVADRSEPSTLDADARAPARPEAAT